MQEGTAPASPSTTTVSQTHDIVLALRAGDESAFAALVDAHHPAMVRLAARYVPSDAIAQEVAQEAWLAFLGSLSRFEGRSSIKTWLFRTLLNCARNRRRAEVRSVPFCALFDPTGSSEPAVDEARFQTQGPWAGNWAVPPRSFGEDGEGQLLRGELRALIASAVELLPPAQREVITLRDIAGFSAEEAAEVLNVSEANQRVLLHRARSRVRAKLEAYFQREDGNA
jgi:RNA polymerase sigma-70 factor (ECF subfamily)